MAVRCWRSAASPVVAADTMRTCEAPSKARRRLAASSKSAREAVIAAITSESSALESPGPAGAAIALRAVLPDATTLTGAERQMLGEWLDRLATSGLA